MNEQTPVPTPSTTLAILPEPTRKAARRARVGHRRLMFGAAAIAAVAVAVGTGFTVQASVDTQASIAETTANGQAGAYDSSQLGAYSNISEARAGKDARDTISAANGVIAAADGKVDASALQTSVASLGDYATMSVADITELTTETKAEAEKTRAATEEHDRQAAEAAAAAAAKAAADAAAAQAAANTVEGAKATAQSMAASKYGWGGDQFSCLVSLWSKESGWNYQAYNAGSGATGIPQALPGSKMASAGSDWQSNASTQISWGLDYISRAYGTPCAAWGHSQSVNWY
ncbi:hypothetical protein [Agromyces seonyuensis]|uniref:aggregation-promoting factor C-terminal-like domain-containing protein n=1 Tax=Agromyces seonyuensis TaxID=2662446 RepID=UPI001F43EA17|nr:hypothetical protein [Agromyces seonyuensis]